jgi:octaprenyl-diphosphate synthase
MTDDLLTSLAPLTGRINETMRGILSEDANLLGEAALYNLMGGGKRLRPLIFCLSHAALGGEMDEGVFRLASTFEFLHMASLMHDDIVDQADTRRGRPAAHHIFGIPETVMAADYLLAKASMMALVKRNIDVAMIMSDVVANLSLGELWELKARSRADLSEEDYFGIILKKTAVLLEAVAWAAGVLLDAEEGQISALRDYGRRLGLAFQIMDDILDYRSDAAVLGKPVGQDLGEGRITLPFILARERLGAGDRDALMALGSKNVLTEADKKAVGKLVDKAGGLEKSLEKAKALSEEAVKALTVLPESGERETLARLAFYTVGRDR